MSADPVPAVHAMRDRPPREARAVGTSADKPGPMRRAARRAQLLEVARQILREDGIGALTMSALAKRAGAAKPIVYEHFANREAVAIALLDESFEHSVAYVTPRVKKARTIHEYLDIAIDCLFDLATEGLKIRHVTNGFSSTSAVNEVYLLQEKRSHEVFWSLLRQQIADEAVTEVAAYLLMQMLRQASSQFADRGQPGDRETVKRMVSGAVRNLIPDARNRPTTPGDVLEAAARDREARRQAPGKPPAVD